MSGWLISLEGTEAGRQVAMALALFAAFLHALFGALQKGRHDPWISRAVIDTCYALMALPIALFIVPWPEPHMWPIFATAFVIHAGYKLAQSASYSRGAYSVVYPVMRGTAPLFAVIGAGVLFGERLTPGQWLGLAVLVGGILGLAAYNLKVVTLDRATLGPALGLAVLTGGFVAAYTTYDAYGIRATADPFTFLAWFFLIDGPFMPIYIWRRWRSVPSSDYLPLLRRGILGALVAWMSFGSILLATRIGRVGEAAALRETSVVFAALIAWAVLGDRVGPQRLALMTVIAAGAVMIQLFG